MTIKEALKKIVEAFNGTVTGKNIPGLLKDIITANGGTPTGKNIPSLINEISENVSGGGDSDGTVEVTVVDGVATGYKFAVTIPDGVTEIGESAFKNCYSLASVTIPDSVTSIGISAFSKCEALTSVTIPDGVTAVWDYAFDKCLALTSVTIPDGVTMISDYAFCDCQALTSVTIMATTPPSIGEGAFNGASNNLVIYVPAESVDAYKTASGYWYDYADKIHAITAA